MSKKKTGLLDKWIEEYLRLKANRAAIDAEIEKTKQVIDAECGLKIGEFEDGELALTTGVVKIVLNPPRAIKVVGGAAMKPEERAKLSIMLDQRYRILDINSKLILERYEQDKILKSVLKAEGVKIEQQTRYDVKPLKT